MNYFLAPFFIIIIHLYKVFTLFTFCVFLYIAMYAVNITRAMKIYLSMKLETLSWETIIN